MNFSFLAHAERVIEDVDRVLGRVLFNTVIGYEVLVVLIIKVVIVFDKFLLALFLLGSGPEWQLAGLCRFLFLNIGELLVNQLDVFHGLRHLGFELHSSLASNDSLLQGVFVSVVSVVTRILVQKFVDINRPMVLSLSILGSCRGRWLGI